MLVNHVSIFIYTQKTSLDIVKETTKMIKTYKKLGKIIKTCRIGNTLYTLFNHSKANSFICTYNKIIIVFTQ